jgi:16S rRNA (cytidine1402-2'-O)-methyltransferase
MTGEEAPASNFHIGASAIAAPRLTAGLYLVATPIGNLGDVTLRALSTLAAADVIYCEDTRVTRRLLERYGIKTHTKSCHDYSEAALAPKIAEDVLAGKVIAFASDAGTPLISDPGYRLVQACIAVGASVTALPGASAVLTGLQLSGLATDHFSFIGFLPQAAGERRKVLTDCIASPTTVVAYESPHRLRDCLEDIVAIFGQRQMAVARELTKLHEEVLRGSAAEILALLQDREVIRGECVVMFAGADIEANAMDDMQIARIIRDAAAALPASKAAQHIAKLTGLTRDEAFARVLALKSQP